MEKSRVLLVYKKNNSSARNLACEISSWLERRHWLTDLMEGQTGNYEFSALCYAFVIVLGGDGTILGVARHLAGSGVPLFGINFGKVGFLAASSPHSWKEDLQKILAGENCPRSCLALRWELMEGDTICQKGHAVNDIVLGRGRMARLLSINIRINSHDLGSVRSDGIIITTPLGSSAYGVSAGGPLIHPDLQASAVIAICPFMSCLPPLLLSADAKYVLKAETDSSGSFLTVDGQELWPVARHQYIRVSGWAHAIRLFGSEKRFFQHLWNNGLKNGVFCHGEEDNAL